MAMSTLTKRDEEILGNLFEMVGYCEAVVGIRSKHSAPKPENKYLGRTVEQVAFHIHDISRELNEFAKEYGFE
jgi:hypothetical protein